MNRLLPGAFGWRQVRAGPKQVYQTAFQIAESPKRQEDDVASLFQNHSEMYTTKKVMETTNHQKQIACTNIKDTTEQGNTVSAIAVATITLSISVLGGVAIQVWMGTACLSENGLELIIC